MRISKKFLSIFLAALMAVSMMPFTVFAGEASPYADLNNTTTAITFDNKQWYMIEDNSTSATEGTVTLLSKECVGKSAYNSSGSFVTYDNNPTIKEAVDTWYSSNITADAKTAVADNKAFILESLTGINADVLKCNQVSGTYYNVWWLCSRSSDTRAMGVDGDGGYLYDGPVKWEYGVRPALKLDLSKVEFNSETKTFALPAPAAPVKPTATVTEIPYAVAQQYFPDAPAMDVVYAFVANNDGDDIYKTYNADFVISFDKAVPQGAVKLYGQYGQYPITECPITKDLAANEEYRLLKDSMGLDMTYQQILDEVQTFFCGAKYAAAAAGATMTIKLAIYETAVNPETGLPEETGTEVEIDDAEQTDTAPALPQATVTDITNTEENELNLDAAYKFEAPAGTSAYDDEYCDFIVRFDQDVTSDDIELWGKYGAYDWTNLASEASGDAYTFEAGKDYYLLRDVIKWPMTYAQIRQIGTFYCGVNSYYGANGATMDVELALYEEPAEGEEPVAVVLDDEEFVAPDKPDPATQDEISITTADEIDVNLYLAETGEEATVEYTFNTTPDQQTNVQGTKTVDFDSLPEVAGKRKLTIRVAPAQIKDNIDIDIKNASGNVIRSYDNYSVAAYCDELIAGKYTNAVKTLAKSVLDYGKAASAFFGYNTNAFANQADNFNGFNFDTTGFTAQAEGITINEVRYVATSVPSLRFKVDMAEDEAATLTATTDKGYEAKFVKVENDVILQVTGIPAAKLGETITITVSNGATIQYTPLVYAYMASKANNAELSRLGSTIGQYASAANAVFA